MKRLREGEDVALPGGRRGRLDRSIGNGRWLVLVDGAGREEFHERELQAPADLPAPGRRITKPRRGPARG